MLNFRSKAINSLGEVLTLDIAAPTLVDARDQLLKEGYTIISINKFNLSSMKLKYKEVIDFTQTLSILVESNLTLKDAVNTGIKSKTGKKVKKLFSDLSYGLNRGESFSGILSQPKWGFSKLYKGLISVGEKTGNLKDVLNELKIYLDREKKLRDRVTTSMVYPIFIMFFSLLFSMVFIFFVLPQFQDMFSSFGADITLILEKRIKSFTATVFTLAFLILITIFIGVNQRSLRKNGSQKATILDKLLLKIPKVGNLLLNNETLNLLFALKVLTGSKLQIEESLDFSRSVLKNSYLIGEVEAINSKLKKGDKLSKAFSESVFPERVSSFLRIGEETGSITEILQNLSTYYLRENNKLMDLALALIDPIFTLMVGLSILYLIVMFILPLLTQLGGLF